MGLNKSALGKMTPSVPTVVEQGRIGALCDVVNDHNPAYLESWRGGPAIAPPTFINCFRDTKSQLLIEELGVDMPKLLHGEQQMYFYRPIRVGETVHQQIAIVDVAEKETAAMGRADFFTVWITLRDDEDVLVAEAYQSFFVRNAS